MSEIRTDTINNASGDNDSGIDLSTNDQVKIKTANTTVMTVSTGGFTLSPATNNLYEADGTLSYYGTTNNVYLNGAGSGGGLLLSGDGTRAENVDISAANNTIIFDTDSSERMRIDGSGNLLVGTTSATGSIQKGVAIHFTAAVGAGLELKGSNTTGTFSAAIFRDGNGTDCGSIDVNATANTTAYTTSSDHRLKENVTADWDATTRLKQLNPVRFNFITDADTTVDGFLAHEVQSVVPEAITGTHNEVDDDGNPVYQGIDQSKLVPLLVKTIQELEARITALENA